MFFGAASIPVGLPSTDVYADCSALVKGAAAGSSAWDWRSTMGGLWRFPKQDVQSTYAVHKVKAHRSLDGLTYPREMFVSLGNSWADKLANKGAQFLL